jgi:hypothetical protein
MDGGGGATAGAAGGSVQTCTTPVMEYCAAKSSFTCTPTWAAVLADTSECPLIGTGVDDLRGACGGIDVRELFLVLEEDDVYYDVTTGNLVAIWSRAAGAPGSCLAGPANFVPPMCATDALSKVSCPDGGADGPDASPD